MYFTFILNKEINIYFSFFSHSSSVSENITVYFHAVISKEFPFDPEKDVVVLKSEALLGSWKGWIKMFPRFESLIS